ncbi:FtsL-like putative cell division protein [uncultured Bacteroides sp.]|uniref:FtsB family cell division protein n=1 Tax=uncultured Bacteroides sp. TaxID=162156 RepID=UPI002AA60FB1|nr:FtsL-like putative cell division protein [uncultured Bacteroides sp.]
MIKLLTIWNFIRKHKYWITVLIFVTIIGFLDENSMVHRVSNIRKINKLHESIKEYQADYNENSKKLNELTTNPRSIEKVAREKYLMKKPNEDVYVIQADSTEEEPQK